MKRAESPVRYLDSLPIHPCGRELTTHLTPRLVHSLAVKTFLQAASTLDLDFIT
jgi:hypothetical protein